MPAICPDTVLLLSLLVRVRLQVEGSPVQYLLAVDGHDLPKLTSQNHIRGRQQLYAHRGLQVVLQLLSELFGVDDRDHEPLNVAADLLHLLALLEGEFLLGAVLEEGDHVGVF